MDFELDVKALYELAFRAGKPKLLRAAEVVTELRAGEGEGFEPL